MEIEGNNNIQINGDGNHINKIQHYHYHCQEIRQLQQDTFPKIQKETYLNHSINEHTLEFSVKVFRNLKTDLIFLPFILLFIINSKYFGIPFNPTMVIVELSIIIWYFLLPLKIASMLISVYSEKLSIGDKIINYKDIRSYRYEGNNFYYKMYNDDKEFAISFYTVDAAEYLFYKIDTFAIHYGVKI